MSTTAPSTAATAIEVEETLARIRSHKGVEGILIMTKEGAIIHSSLSEEQSKTHAVLVSSLTQKASALIVALDDGDDSPSHDPNHESNEKEGEGCASSSSNTNASTGKATKDELAFLRVRSQKKEIMIAPDKDFLLVVIQNPSAAD